MEEVYKVGDEHMCVKATIDLLPDSPRDGQVLGKIIGRSDAFDIFDRVVEEANLYHSWDLWRRGELPKDCVCVPVYAQVSSSIRLATYPFEDDGYSGQVGFIVATRPEIRNHFDVRRVTFQMIAKAERAMRQEIQLLDQYLNTTYYVVQALKEGEVIFAADTMTAASLDDFLLELPAGFDELIAELKKQML